MTGMTLPGERPRRTAGVVRSCDAGERLGRSGRPPARRDFVEYRGLFSSQAWRGAGCRACCGFLCRDAAEAVSVDVSAHCWPTAQGATRYLLRQDAVVALEKPSVPDRNSRMVFGLEW